jgi:phosphoribosylanthranilate isomerase
MARVKICGLTNSVDACAAAQAGANYLGFIFYPPSPRSVTAEAVVEIVRELGEHRPVLVGVFVNESPAQIAAILARCGLDLAQLSGDETPSAVGDPTSPLYGRSYKALRPASRIEAEADAEWFVPPRLHPEQPALLLDTYHPTLRGGTGRIADWSIAAELAAAVPRLMLAGGLTPENVAQAVAQVRPYAVDVASGVEAAPGRKDHDAVRAFIAQAHL